MDHKKERDIQSAYWSILEKDVSTSDSASTVNEEAESPTQELDHEYREWIVERIEAYVGTLHGNDKYDVGICSLDTDSLERLFSHILGKDAKRAYEKHLQDKSNSFSFFAKDNTNNIKQIEETEEALSFVLSPLSGDDSVKLSEFLRAEGIRFKNIVLDYIPALKVFLDRDSMKAAILLSDLRKKNVHFDERPEEAVLAEKKED